MQENRVAILHDQFRTMGGAERVACEIARALDAPIYAMRVDDDIPPSDVDVRQLASGRGEWLMRRHYLVQDAYQMLAWQHQPDLYEYDIIVQTKTNPYWFVFNSDSQTLIRYCHSTPRGMYDQFRRRGGDVVGDVMKTIQRMLYQQVVAYPDAWMANSEVVQRRMGSYFGVPNTDIDVVYPPVDTTQFSPDDAATQDYVFYVGRLAVNKRIPLIKQIARRLDTEVVVAGSGPYEDELLEDAPDNLTYLGYISETEKQRRLSEARASLMLAESEDFGITPIESFAAGTPVVGVDEGYTQHQVLDGRNGRLCQPSVASVSDAIRDIEASGVAWSPSEIAGFAENYFGVDRFREQIQRVITDAEQNAAIEPPWEDAEPTATDDSPGVDVEIVPDGGHGGER